MQWRRWKRNDAFFAPTPRKSKGRSGFQGLKIEIFIVAKTDEGNCGGGATMFACINTEENGKDTYF